MLMINGSPHKEGSTFTALTEIAERLSGQGIDSEIFHIGTGPVRGCIACHKCRELGKCQFDDDCANEISQKIASSDGLVIGSPVYYSGPNGALLSLLDRVFFSTPNPAFALKPAAAVVVCRRGGSTAAFDRLNKYFGISSMYTVGSRYWNILRGMTPEMVKEDAEGLAIMRKLADNIAYILKCFELSKGKVEPAAEAPFGPAR
ncbi:MAG: flavodoxin family protein [Eubacteriaceae bacterium]|nr:flavodoxin family protein [Eubacteriaceae bacterium]